MSLNARSIAVKGFGYGALAVALAGFVGVTPPSPVPPSAQAGGSERVAPLRPIAAKQVKGDLTSRGTTTAEIIPVLEAVRAMATQGASQAGAAAVSEAVRDIASAGSSRASIEIGNARLAVFSDTEMMALAAWYSRG